ncbi:urea amidolyase associated protein UAAP1 [Hydrogenophaga sp. T2]|uniref:urea amidolyase associated protein UAAP1 n=1 Tax=Hydrogenophaga sp. T2 TaxID=3132823 RepID=UPI003CF34BCC
MSASPQASPWTEPHVPVPDNPPPAAPVDAPALWQRFPAAALAGVDTARAMWSETVPGGGHWSWRMPRGSAIRFVALEDGPNVSVLLYSALEKLERYNMPDSLKAQHTAHYRAGHVLMSDMGRSLASITADSLGWHDPLGALLDNARMAAKYGERRYADARNAMYRSGQDGLLIEIGKHGLGKRDLIAPVNLFSKVAVDEEGRFRFASDHAKVGDFVELRFDMDVILAISTAPHALDPKPVYAPAKVGLLAWRCGPAPANDPCRAFRPENARALHNSDQLYL